MTNKIYNIPYTDSNKPSISVPRRIFIDDIVDITLIGKRTLEYGQVFNENLLHLMEHFACDSDPDNLHMPNSSSKLASVLENPVNGQLWYSKNTGCLFVWVSTEWKSFNKYNTVKGNSGFIYDGEYIPMPLDDNGVPFDISDCAISIAPILMVENIEAFRCTVDNSGYVTSKYTPVGGAERSGHATFIVVGKLPCRLTPP